VIKDVERLIVPTIVLYEVFKILLRENGEDTAIRAQAHMQQGTVAELTAQIAVSAAKTSIDKRLPMADSIILSTAPAFDAKIWAQDEHFRGMKSVNYFPA
jgi:toxin FitB